MASLNKGQWLHFVWFLCLFVWWHHERVCHFFSECHFTLTVCFTEQPFLTLRLHLLFIFSFPPMWSIDKNMPLTAVRVFSFFFLMIEIQNCIRRHRWARGKRMLMWYRFSTDMIIKHVECQIKAALMKDRHQSATSLEKLEGMTWLSRSRNMVTHPSLISLSWPIDQTFISIRLAFIASVMNSQTTDILHHQTCLLDREKKRWQSVCDSRRWVSQSDVWSSMNPRQHDRFLFVCLFTPKLNSLQMNLWTYRV